MFKGKPTKVVITGEAKEEFDNLNKVVGEEIAKGITSSDHQTLLNSIKQKIEILKANPEYGTHIQKDRIPKDMMETGVPFVIITNKEVPLTELATGGYETATFLYLGLNDEQCAAIQEVNSDNGVFMVNASDLQKRGRWHQERIGEHLGEMFFKAIDVGRRNGITAMRSIVREMISPEIKKARNRLLFADDLYDIGAAGHTYWRLQERYKAFPLIEQLADGVLMEVCPTGSCLRLAEPYYGCCGGGNIPDAMIDFAITYRKKLGDARFIGELTKYHNGTQKEPWYLKTRFYQRNFRGGLPELTANKAQDVAKIDLTF